MILKEIHKTGKDNFEFSERQLIYSFIDKYTSSSLCVDELIDTFHEKETDFENLVENLITNRFKEDNTSIFKDVNN